jgi:hypothetical protein
MILVNAHTSRSSLEEKSSKHGAAASVSMDSNFTTWRIEQLPCTAGCTRGVHAHLAS